LKLVFDVEENIETEDIPTSFNAERITLLKGTFGHSKSKPKGIRWNLKTKYSLYTFSNTAQNPTLSSDSCYPAI